MNICQYNKLKRFDSELTLAVKCNCKRGFMNDELDYLIQVGSELGIECNNRNCPKCVLDFLINLGKPYLAFKDKLESKKKKKGDDKDEEGDNN